MAAASFRFRRIADETATVCVRLRDALMASPDECIRGLVGDLDEAEGLVMGRTSPPLSLAFVGQYNAGKSTLISALTRREDIPIDADVCTDTVTAYDWRGIRLLDTPGVEAGHPAHDEQTRRCVDEADLVLFVITGELFDDTTAAYFRRIAFEDGKAAEMMLVVNKMNQTPGTREVFRPDIERVTEPYALEDLRTVFVDAQAGIEAQSESDPTDQEALLEVANIGALEQSIDEFVSERGLWGRLTTPLCTVRGIAHSAISMAPIEGPGEPAIMSRLSRALRELQYSESRLRSEFDRLLSQAHVDVLEIGDELVEHLRKGTTQEKLERASADAQERLRKCAERLESDAIRAFEQEWSDLAGRLEHMAESDLSQAMVRDLPTGQDVSHPPVSEATKASGPADAKGYAAAVETVGTTLARLSSGPAAPLKPGALTGASGSPMHEAVKKVGGFLGHKFKPWEAVKWAKWIGKMGELLAKAGPVIDALLIIVAEKQRAKQEKELALYRSNTRTYYRQIADELAVRFREWTDGLSSAAYGAHRDYLEQEMQRLRDVSADAAHRQVEFDQIIALTTSLIGEAQHGWRDARLLE